jgi:glycosyltransferase involved in cell wall biosynthesis
MRRMLEPWPRGSPHINESSTLAPGRPTIAQIIPHLDSGGAEITTLEVTEAIVKAGGRALVLTEGGRLAARIAEVGGEVVAFPAASKNPARILWNALELKRIAGREKVGLIHARSRAPAWSGLIAARSLRLPFVTTYHGAYKEAGRLKNLYNGVMARSDVVIANSQYTARSIRARYGKPESGIAIIYRGVDFERFAPERIAAERIAALRARWGIKAGQRIVLHAARLSPLKGQPVVIEAARLLKESGRLGNAVFILAGGDQGRTAYAEDLAAQIRAGGLEACVRLVGHADDMPGSLTAAHVALMVSVEPEGFGRVAAEAQAMGCPVIVTEIGALPEALLAAPRVAEQEITGWTVPPGDAPALADAIFRALAMPDAERTAMANRARTYVVASYSARDMQRQTLAVYDRLLGTSLAARFAAGTDA